ncbi:MAG: single-stranded-DNA-specific exonuclease RecJ [Clostridia bacterium]|nr:single-stranded-DNA-specific exonuclease RecJ [Clostridia bacterium]
MGEKLWVYKEVPEEKVKEICNKASVSDLLAKIFLGRGIEDCDYIKRFLNPSLAELHDPFLMKDMDRAVARIVKAINSKEKIMVFGDYDVDGITSTSILYDFLCAQGASVGFYIPDRINEGYGLSISAIDRVIQGGVSLIITVDCGITAVEEVKYIKDNNIDIVITDHHECKGELPQCDAVINPWRNDCPYPFKELAGVGVVYKLINAICIDRGLGDLHHHYLDLVAVGTIADVVPLVGENRIIVKQGLLKLHSTSNIGLKTIINNCALKDKPITSWTVSFVIAPRINAAGRIGDAGRAVRLFITRDSAEAMDIALKLHDENKFRQDTELEILQQVLSIIDSDVKLQEEKIIVVAGEGWHHGVIGIVASKITERYHRPCILISVEGEIGKGSGRSIDCFNLFKALVNCEELLERYGGHELAAGLTIRSEKISLLRTMINEYAASCLTDEDLIPRVKIDVRLSKSDVTLDSVNEIEMLAPFGAGNPSPVFGYEGLKVEDIRTVGDNKHLKLRLEDRGAFFDAIGFNMGSLMDSFEVTDLLDVACSLEINTWNSIKKLQLNLKDIRENHEITMQNRYFYSLDKCIKLDSLNSGKSFDEVTYKNNIISDEDFIKKILSFSKDCIKAAVLVNSMESAKKLEILLEKSELGIKKIYKVCYTDSSDIDITKINIIINPDPEKVPLRQFSKVVFFGEWINKAYMKVLTDKVDGEKIFVYCDTGIRSLDADVFVPERRDLVAVYQYIKASGSKQLLIGNLFLFAKRISNSYKIFMNYFKLKKSIEIFEELGLMESEPYGEFGMSIIINSNENKKANLESSILYKRLQDLKSQVKGA